MRNITLSDGWIYGKLGEFISEVRLRNKNNEISRVLSVTNNKGFLESKEYFNKQVYSKDLINYKIVKRNQIAYNPSRINVGSIDVLENFDEGIISPLYVICSCNKRLLPRYLVYYLKSDRGNAYIRGNTSGSVRDTLKFSDLCNIDIIVPPLEKQKKIVELLEKVEDTIEKRKESIKLLDELVKSQFSEMFGDAVDNPMNWEKKKLREIVTDDCTISYGIVQTGDDQPKGIPVFRPVDIVNRVPLLEELKKTTKEISDKYKKTILKGREMLITVRANIADTCIVGEEFKGCNVGRGIVPIRTKEDVMILEFLKYQIDSKHLNDNIKSMAKGITLIQLNMEDLREVELIIPSLTKQKAFAVFAKQVDKLKFEMEKSQKELEDNFNSLMQRAFNGELFI